MKKYDDNYISIPDSWVFSLSGEDFRRMVLLNWRFSFYLSQAGGDQDKEKVFYESQTTLCKLFGMSEKSYPSVNKFILKMEDMGLLRVIRSTFVNTQGVVKPRHYLIINNPRLLNRYGVKF